MICYLIIYSFWEGYKVNTNCKKCIHRREFKEADENVTLFLCISEPYDEEEEFGIVTWLDVKDFHSDECMNFKAS
jgi:hypothetical protein